MNTREKQLLWNIERNVLRTTVFLLCRAIHKLLETPDDKNRKFAIDAIKSAEEAMK